jgi:hypothetical protein
MRSTARPPKNAFRRIERWLVGLLMGILAFVIEKAVLRSIKKGGGVPKPTETAQPFATSKGNEISGG